MAEGRPNCHIGSIPHGEDKNFLPYITGKVVAAQASPYSIHLSPVREKDIEWQNDTNYSKPIPIQAGDIHLVETMFYNEWALFGESSVSKLIGTFVLKWEDIQDDPKLDLRKLLL